MDPRRFRFARRVVTLAVTISALAPRAARAQSYQILHTFTIGAGDGAQPFAALIQGSDGNFYGTTGNGGTNNVGTVFKMDPFGQVTILHSFVTTDGMFPKASLVQGSDGWLYGTTSSQGTLPTPGGAAGAGTVFKIVDLPGYGVWVLANGSSWRLLHSLHPTTIVTADLDGNGRDDVVFDFPGYGLWVYTDSGTWALLHSLSASHIAAGHVDANAKTDLVIDFGLGVGIWVYRNNATWSFLHGSSSGSLLLADLDGTGKDEVIVDFGPAYGLWQYANDAAWSQLHGFSAAGVTGGRFY